MSCSVALPASCLPFTLRSASKGPALLTLRSSVDTWAQMSNDPAEGSVEPCSAAGTQSPLGPFLPFAGVLSSSRVGFSRVKSPRKLSVTGKDMGLLNVQE